MKVINIMVIEILQKRSNFDISMLGDRKELSQYCILVGLRSSNWVLQNLIIGALGRHL